MPRRGERDQLCRCLVCPGVRETLATLRPTWFGLGIGLEAGIGIGIGLR